jgi:hypothetical protein
LSVKDISHSSVPVSCIPQLHTATSFAQVHSTLATISKDLLISGDLENLDVAQQIK